MKSAAYNLLLPDAEREVERDDEEDDNTGPLDPDHLLTTICQSWKNTRGVHMYMKGYRKLDKPTLTPFEVPACPKDTSERGVLHTREQSTEGTIITSVVGDDNRWYQNQLTLPLVKNLRQTGVFDQMVFDKVRRIMFCGNPKAGLTFFKSWLMKHYDLWRIKDPKRITHAFDGKKQKGLVSGKHMKDSELLDALNSGGYFKVCIPPSHIISHKRHILRKNYSH